MHDNPAYCGARSDRPPKYITADPAPKIAPNPASDADTARGAGSMIRFGLG